MSLFWHWNKMIKMARYFYYKQNHIPDWNVMKSTKCYVKTKKKNQSNTQRNNAEAQTSETSTWQPHSRHTADLGTECSHQVWEKAPSPAELSCRPHFFYIYLECMCVHTCTRLCIKIHVWNTQGTTFSAVHLEGPRDWTQVMSLVTSAQYAKPSWSWWSHSLLFLLAF